MPLTDTQLAGMITLLAERERDVMILKAHVLALEELAIRLAGGETKQQLVQAQQELLDSTSFDGSRAAIRSLEQVALLLTSPLPETVN